MCRNQVVDEIKFHILLIPMIVVSVEFLNQFQLVNLKYFGVKIFIAQWIMHGAYLCNVLGSNPHRASGWYVICIYEACVFK